ncbi:hypothetical protein ACOME3_001188 [Neoechinorhynchus agilis]
MNDHNMVHRDLKLENIVLAPDGNTKLIDFGLSKALSSLDKKMYTFCGTLDYIAPEMNNMDKYNTEGYNYKIDWWALGTLLYEMVNGDVPYLISKLTTNNKRVYLKNLPREAVNLADALLNVEPEKRISGEDVFKDSFFQKYTKRHFETNSYPVLWKPNAFKLSQNEDQDIKLSLIRPSQMCMLQSASNDIFDRFTFVNSDFEARKRSDGSI